MSTCPNCGAQVHPQSQFCLSCGSVVNDGPEQGAPPAGRADWHDNATTTAYVGGGAGQEHAGDQGYGHGYDQGYGPAYQPGQRGRGGNKLPAIIAVAAAVVALALAVTFMTLHNSGNSSAASSTSSSSGAVASGVPTGGSSSSGVPSAASSGAQPSGPGAGQQSVVVVTPTVTVTKSPEGKPTVVTSTAPAATVTQTQDTSPAAATSAADQAYASFPSDAENCTTTDDRPVPGKTIAYWSSAGTDLRRSAQYRSVTSCSFVEAAGATAASYVSADPSTTAYSYTQHSQYTDRNLPVSCTRADHLSTCFGTSVDSSGKSFSYGFYMTDRVS